MADNVGYTPGVGETIATDNVGGVQIQRVKVVLGSDGFDDGNVWLGNPLPITAPNAINVAGDILSQSQLQQTIESNNMQNPLTDAQLRATPINVTGDGELMECLEATRMGVQSLLRGIGGSQPDTVGRVRTVVERVATIDAGTITTVSTVTTVTTVSTVSNQTNIGGVPATEHIPALMRMAADGLRRNISVT